MDIGKNIRRARSLRALSFKELGELIGKTKDVVKKYEDGEIVPALDTIMKIAEVLDVPVTDLLGVKEKPSKSVTLKELYKKQHELDQLIVSTVKDITEKELLLSRIVAMFTEIGEWANQEQTMKYWKKNKNVDREKELEEYCDILFFLLSIGNLKGYAPGEVEQAYLKKYEKNIERQRNNY